MDNTLHDPFKLEERLSHKIGKADVLLPLVIAAMLWTAGLVDLISHVSPEPQLFGIWSVPFFLALIAYGLGFVGLYWLIVPRDSLERVQGAIGYIQQRSWLGVLIVAAAGGLIFTILIWDQWLYFPLLSIAMLMLAVVVIGMLVLVNGAPPRPMQTWRKVLLGIIGLGLAVEVGLQVATSFGALPGYRNLSGLFVPYGHIYQHDEGFGNDGTNRYGYYYPEFELGTGARHILLKGDTFVQALQVGHADLFGVRLEHQLDAAGVPASVMGLGYPGYGPGLYADTLLYPFTDAPLKPDEVVIFFHLANDLQVQASPTDGPRPYYFINAEGKVEIDPGSYISRHDLQHMIIPGYDPINLVRTLESRSLVLEQFMTWWRGFRGQPEPVALLPAAIDLATAEQPFGPATFAFRADEGPEAAHAFAIATGLLDNYRARLAEDGVTLRIVTIPYFPPAFYAQGDGAWTSALGEYDLFAPERALVAYAEANGIDILPLGAEMQASGLTREQVRALFFREGSGHFTPAGHAWVAQALYDSFYAPRPQVCYCQASMTATSNAARTVARNSAMVLAAQIGVKALSFLFTVYVVRQLGPDAFGTYTAIGAFGFLFIFVADLGLSTYAVREVARLRDQHEGARAIADLHADLLLLRILLALLSGGLTVAFGWVTGRPDDMMLGLALNVIGLTLSGVQSASGVMLGGFERMDVGAWGMMLNQLAFVALGALALWGGYGFLGLIVANLIAIAVTTAYIVTAARAAGIGLGRFRPARWSGLLRASLPFGIVTFALGLSYKFDTVLLELTRSSTETGLYNAAYNLIFTCVVLSNVINTSLYPTLSRISVTTPERLTALYSRALRFLWTAAFPIAIGGYLLAGDLVPFLFDSAYTTAATALRILIWAVPLMYTTEFLGYVILIANRERLVARSVLVSTGLNVVANLIVVPIFGFVGAAAVTLATETILVCQYLWLLRDQLRGMDLQRGFVRPLLAAGLMGLVVSLLPVDWHVVLKIALGAAVYALLALPLGLITRDDIGLLRRRSEDQTGNT